MENESLGQRIKNTTRKILKRILIFGLLIIFGVMAFLYWATYESGIMAGKVLRVSEKGMLFKTVEGKLNLETFGALKGASPIAESFDFSVEKGEREVIQQLQEVALSGDRANLYLIKRYATFPAPAQLMYFVPRVQTIQ